MSDVQLTTAKRGRKPKTENQVEGQAPGEAAADVPGETKADKFTRLAANRTSNVLYHLANVGKLSGSGYEWSPEQKAKMFAAIRKATDDAEAKYAPKAAAGKPAFTF
jgi:hypothetical protein